MQQTHRHFSLLADITLEIQSISFPTKPWKNFENKTYAAVKTGQRVYQWLNMKYAEESVWYRQVVVQAPLQQPLTVH